MPLYFVANEARKHVKVVLSGEGADELFGGYNIYREPTSLRRITGVAGSHAQGPGGGRDARCRKGSAGKDMLRRGALDLEERYYGNARIFREEQLAGLLRTYSPDRSFRDVTDPIYAQSLGSDPIARMQHIDLFTWLRGDILVKADKMTMANSLELRVPFLDPEVFEVARTIPPEQKVTRQTTKLALRRAMELIVPPHVLNRRKLGFPVPIRHFLAEGSYDWARSIITHAQTERVPGPRRRAGPAGRPPGRRGRLLPADLDRSWCSSSGTRSSSPGAITPGDPGAGLPGPAVAAVGGRTDSSDSSDPDRRWARRRASGRSAYPSRSARSRWSRSPRGPCSDPGSSRRPPPCSGATVRRRPESAADGSRR